MNVEKEYTHEQRNKIPPPIGGGTLPKRLEDVGAQQAMNYYLHGRGLSAELAINNGWYVSRDCGDDNLRIVMPATNTKGYVYWQARAIDPQVEKRYRSPVYAASDSIIVVWPDAEGMRKRRAAIVEGPMDALAAAEHGYVGVAVMGKRPSREVFDHILKLLPRYRFIVVPDADGLTAGVSIVANLAARGIMAEMKYPFAKDLASLPREQRRGLLE